MGNSDTKKRKVILMGKGILAVQVADWFLRSPDYELVRIVPEVPEPTWTESISVWAKKNNIAFVESGHFKDIPGVKDESWNMDLAVSVFYGKIVKDWFIKKCKKIINLHNSPLPRYRGVSPINWALKNGEIEHGVTLHEIVEGIDTGPIIAQIKYSIYPEFEKVIDVYNRALKYGWVLFQQTMPLIDKIKPRPQNDSLATYYNAKQNEMLGERGFTSWG